MTTNIDRILARFNKQNEKFFFFSLARELDANFDLSQMIQEVLQKSQKEFETILPKIKDWLIESIKNLESKGYAQRKILDTLESQITSEYSKEQSPLVRGIYIKILKMVREFKSKGIQVPQKLIQRLEQTAISALKALGIKITDAKAQVSTALNQLRAEVQDFDDRIIDPQKRETLLSDLVRKAINIEL